MPRLPRVDRPGQIHHVMNRGLARRTVFETRRDVRFFLSLVARAARDGLIEVVAYSILTTHFHLVVRSLKGQLSGTMRRILNTYVRWFNRTRGRDGPLFRGRFRSVPVRSGRQLAVTIRYVDENATDARLSPTTLDYPYASARAHAGLARRPRWLSGKVVDAAVEAWMRHGVGRSEAYGRAFPPRVPPPLRRLVEAPTRLARRDADAWADLVTMAPPELAEWMSRRARIADGSRPALPLVPAEAVDRALATARPDAVAAAGPDGARTFHVGLLHDVAGERLRDIARRLGCSVATASRLRAAYRDALELSASCRSAAAALAHAAAHDPRWVEPSEAALSAYVAA